jgi:hypothetical protein
MVVHAPNTSTWEAEDNHEFKVSLFYTARSCPKVGKEMWMGNIQTKTVLW